MTTYVINSDLTASADIEKPVKGSMTGMPYLHKLNAWYNRNRYPVNDKTGLTEGMKVTGILRDGLLFIEEILWK